MGFNSGFKGLKWDLQSVKGRGNEPVSG